MAQPAPLQVEVHRATLTATAARDQLSNPLQTGRRGEIQSLTITVPLLSERNTYLSVRLPANVVQDLLTYVGTLPENQRRDYLSEWIVRNQQAVLSQYIQSGRTQRAFRYDVVPTRIEPSVVEAVPRRVEPQVTNVVPRREEASPHRFIESVHVYPGGGTAPFGWLGTIPAGWRAPRENDYTDLPQEVRTRANVLRPPRGPGQVPMGEGRVEEFNGRRYMYLGCYHTIPSPTHESITVLVPDENAGRQPAPPPPVVVPGPQVQERAPPTPRQENRELQGGSGTRRDPFVVNVQRDRSTRDDVSGTPIELPISFDVGGRVYFRFSLTLSQLANSKIDQTYAEIIRIARATIGTMPDYSGGRVSLRQDLPGFRDTVRRSLSGQADLIRYMDSH
jgi:hypothetical protein